RHRDEWLIRDILDEVDIELGDVLDMPRLLDVIKRHRITHIVHAAAFVGAVSAANPALSVQVNVMGMVNLLEAARVRRRARGLYQREGRLWAGAGRIRRADLPAGAGRPPEESQAHLRFRQADGRAGRPLLPGQYGYGCRGTALCHHLRTRED